MYIELCFIEENALIISLPWDHAYLLVLSFMNLNIFNIRSTIPCSTMGTMKSVTPEDHKILKENFWDKNKRLARPMSPHLGIYKVTDKLQ